MSIPTIGTDASPNASSKLEVSHHKLGDLLSADGTVQLEALAACACNVSGTADPSTKQGLSSLLANVARFDPTPSLRASVIAMPQFPESVLSLCLHDSHATVREAAAKHPAVPTSALLQHLAFETNERVIITCLASLRDLSDEQALEALGVKESDAFADGEFYAVLRDTAEHYSPAVRMAVAPFMASCLKSDASEHAFAVLEQLLCDIPRVACAAIHAMLAVSHSHKLSERAVRALISLCDAGEISAMHLLRDVPCKTISGYAFLQFWMERKVYNAMGDSNRQELNQIFSCIVVRNETFARVLDFSKKLYDKQWLWRGERNTT